MLLLLSSVLLNKLFSRDSILSLFIELVSITCAVINEIEEEVHTVLAISITSGVCVLVLPSLHFFGDDCVVEEQESCFNGVFFF